MCGRHPPLLSVQGPPSSNFPSSPVSLFLLFCLIPITTQPYYYFTHVNMKQIRDISLAPLLSSSLSKAPRKAATLIVPNSLLSTQLSSPSVPLRLFLPRSSLAPTWLNPMFIFLDPQEHLTQSVTPFTEEHFLHLTSRHHPPLTSLEAPCHQPFPFLPSSQRTPFH